MQTVDVRRPLPELMATAIDLPSPVPGVQWRAVRGWLDDLGLEFEPTLSPDNGLLGYTIRLRNYVVGVGLGVRSTGTVLQLTAVLCRGMDREQNALAAADRANSRLSMGQILYFPGPPAELSFFTTLTLDLVDQERFGLLFETMLVELDEVGFAAVMQVRGYHPTDYAAPWGDPMLAPFDEDADAEPATELTLADVTGDDASGEETACTELACGKVDSAPYFPHADDTGYSRQDAPLALADPQDGDEAARTETEVAPSPPADREAADRIAPRRRRSPRS